MYIYTFHEVFTYLPTERPGKCASVLTMCIHISAWHLHMYIHMYIHMNIHMYIHMYVVIKILGGDRGL